MDFLSNRTKKELIISKLFIWSHGGLIHFRFLFSFSIDFSASFYFFFLPAIFKLFWCSGSKGGFMVSPKSNSEHKSDGHWSSLYKWKNERILWPGVMKWYHVKCSPVDRGTCIFCQFSIHSNLLLLLFQSSRNGFRTFCSIVCFCLEKGDSIRKAQRLFNRLMVGHCFSCFQWIPRANIAKV